MIHRIPKRVMLGDIFLVVEDKHPYKPVGLYILARCSGKMAGSVHLIDIVDGGRWDGHTTKLGARSSLSKKEFMELVHGHGSGYIHTIWIHSSYAGDPGGEESCCHVLMNTVYQAYKHKLPQQ